ncbi:MAG: AI-2E family transporter [Alphaproteobacteria bacterium]|nr:AI-2E family transporter [Alphaproteobacteria bacterium]
MAPEKRFWILLAILALIVLFLYGIRVILLPFVVGLLVAYFLHPVVDRLSRISWLGRGGATAVVSVGFFAIAGGILILISPMLYTQSIELINKLPDIINHVRTNWFPRWEEMIARFDPQYMQHAKESLTEASTGAVTFATALLAGLAKSGASLVNLVSLLFITPIVTFYMLKDWNNIIASADKLLPRSYAPSIREQAREIDRTLAGYIRGQTNVCLLLAAYYGLGLTLAGLNFGLAIGVLTGVLCFIPFVGFGIGFAVGLATAWFQFGDLSGVGVVAAIFIAGQVIEGNFITPQLVGERVGLHPVWIIFGMLAGGALLGIVGVLVAVPLSAVVGVLIRFAIKRYMKSPLYGSELQQIHHP